jgi:glycosyltransferase involved in cell wall biosynthesis
MADTAEVVLRGEFKSHPGTTALERSFPRLEILLDGKPAARVAATSPGAWEARLRLNAADSQKGSIVDLRLHGCALTNALAWLGRITGLGPIQGFRSQRKNRQVRLSSIESGTGETIYRFSDRDRPYQASFGTAHCRPGMNIVGFITADLGIGESARCMVRSADAASVPIALVPLKLNCLNRQGDLTYGDRLVDANTYGVNVFHIDPPVARDIDHHHGPSFRADRYNIGYFAWELPDFPEVWTSSFDYFDEVWCPSDFVREAVQLKAMFPVLKMPHSISFARPTDSAAALRNRFGLPLDRYLFLCLFDLNSYAARKNPHAVIEAFKKSGLGSRGSTLVIKVQNADLRPEEFSALEGSVREIPGAQIISGTLSRSDVYALEAAADCFVSLHRSEGFGLAVAEAMYLGKPVISTHWSATAEYLDHDNGFPVRRDLVLLTENQGPYMKGSTWANPDTDHAAELMARVASDPAAAARVGAAARRTIEEKFSPAAIGARYKRRLEAIAGL